MKRAALALALFAATSTPPAAQAEAGTFRITAYCQSGVTRSGEWTRPGVVAVDQNVIPLYSSVWIEGWDEPFTALDTGGGVRGNHVDIYMTSCRDAINWGVRSRSVEWEMPS